MVMPKKSESWAQSFRAARGALTQVQAAEVLCMDTPATIRDWEQGRGEPPAWCQHLVIGALMRASLRPKKEKWPPVAF